MRVLLDECLPRRLRGELAGHDVRTVVEMGWRGKRNGELIRAMVGQDIDVLLTIDRNIPYLQNISASGISVIVLAGGGAKIADFLPLMPSALAALASIKPGEVAEITA